MTNFAYLVVPKAGHFVPTTNLLVTKQFLNDFINAQTIFCHDTTGGFCSLTTIQCSYMNDCNSNGNCVDGFCQCNAGFTGADCKAPLIDLIDGYDQTLASNGIEWFYMAYSGTLQDGQSYSLTLDSDNKIMDIYLFEDPTWFPTLTSYDMAFKNQQNLNLNSVAFPNLKTF